MRLRGVIFDVDGTLVNSNDAHARAWVEALEESGRRVPYERVRPLIGMGGDKLLRAAAPDVPPDSAAGKAINARRAEIFRSRFLPTIAAFDGARELLERLASGGLRLAVASSAERQELLPLLRLVGGEDLIEEKVSGDEARESKPAPDVVGAALRKLNCQATEAVMVGDTPYDVEAARAAGCACVAFRCGGWEDAKLAGAAAIYDGPADLLENLGTSPLTTRSKREA